MLFNGSSMEMDANAVKQQRGLNDDIWSQGRLATDDKRPPRSYAAVIIEDQIQTRNPIMTLKIFGTVSKQERLRCEIYLLTFNSKGMNQTAVGK